MKHKTRHIKYIIGFFVIILILILGYCYYNKQKNNGSEPSKEDTTPVPITNWIPYSSNYGFSFMYPANLKIEVNNDLVGVGGILVRVEKLNCKNPIPKKIIADSTKFYGFKAEINESAKTAYICNNTNTACLDITKGQNYGGILETKITEGFFHSFISSLNLNKDFDKIACLK